MKDLLAYLVSLILFSLVPFGGLSSADEPESQSEVRVENGERIFVLSNGREVPCRVTLVKPNMGFTAGHCGATGSLILSEEKLSIGVIKKNSLLEGSGLDAARIEFLPSVVPLYHDVEPRYPLGIHENISVLIPQSEERVGQWLGTSILVKTLNLPNQSGLRINVAESNLSAFPGDSGAPVVNGGGKVIGIVQGGNGKNVVNVTLLDSLMDGG